MNLVGDDGAEAFAEAATSCIVDEAALAFRRPWGLERLYLGDTNVGPRGRGALRGAVAARAAFADTAVRQLEAAADLEAALGSLRDRRIRLPRGLQVFGVALDDGAAAALRNSACFRLRALLPEVDGALSREAFSPGAVSSSDLG